MISTSVVASLWPLGIFGLLFDLACRYGTITKNLVQELDGVAPGVGVLLVLRSGKQVLSRHLGLPEPVDPDGTALSFFEPKHQALRWHREIVLRGCQHAAILVPRVFADHERHTCRPDNADGPSAPVQGIVGGGLVQMPHDQHGGPGPLS